MKKAITFEELTSLNYMIKLLQGMLRIISPIETLDLRAQAGDLCASINQFSASFNVAMKYCKCRLPGQVYDNIVYVPSSPGIVARCAYCKQQYVWSAGEIIELDWTPGHIANLENNFIDKPIWLKSLFAKWDIEHCQFLDVQLFAVNGPTSSFPGAKSFWTIDRISFEDMHKWKQSSYSQVYWQSFLKCRFKKQ